MHSFTNDLIKETSPYLLQHAHNPVNWVAWSDEAFETAKRENKMVLISIGYSACHWCHVMEHESFENEEVATWMNRYFVCIKVDREERPDVDQVYMTAVQLMTQKGGWPLNCFTLPDGRPIYGGTYFQKDNWIQILKSLEHTFKNKRQEVEEYATRLQEGIQNSELIDIPQAIEAFQQEKLAELVLRWSHSFDSREGGSNRAPKFPLPNNYEFLLQFAVNQKDEILLKHVYLTLDKMAFGGIYDQIGGGFCRYSVDVLWKVPHFEKMLYDNSQLVSLYAKAYQQTKNETYKNIVIQTLNWIEREMSTAEGAFYSALDADSEGEEGKFYIWKVNELMDLLENDFSWVKDYYNVNQLGYWEEGNYILMKTTHDADFAKKMNLSLEEFALKINKINELLLSERSLRVRPGLDNKCLTSWNAMQLKAYCDAYFALGDETYLLAALKNARWIEKFQLNDNYTLYHNYNGGKATIEGFLEDYANVISAFISLYQASFDEHYLYLAQNVCQKTIEIFQDRESKMFYFTAENSGLIARKMDINDNVTPATNSIMCMNLFVLGTYFQNDSYISDAKQMLSNVYEGMEQYGSGYSNWAMVLMHFLNGVKEVCITGPNWKQNLAEISKNYLPNVLFSGGLKSSLPSLAGKDLSEDKFYLCENKTCSLPETNLNSFVKKIQLT
ncbi:MAG: thioredoxin domain-containing protein [Flavobacteriia bacterium]